MCVVIVGVGSCYGGRNLYPYTRTDNSGLRLMVVVVVVMVYV